MDAASKSHSKTCSSSISFFPEGGLSHGVRWVVVISSMLFAELSSGTYRTFYICALRGQTLSTHPLGETVFSGSKMPIKDTVQLSRLAPAGGTGRCGMNWNSQGGGWVPAHKGDGLVSLGITMTHLYKLRGCQ